jgi:hypothetical protein
MPKFRFQIVRQFNDSLSRKVAEAVRIDCREEVLNSIAVFSRNSLPRLTVIKPEWEKDRDEKEASSSRRMEECSKRMESGESNEERSLEELLGWRMDKRKGDVKNDPRNANKLRRRGHEKGRWGENSTLLKDNTVWAWFYGIEKKKEEKPDDEKKEES